VPVAVLVPREFIDGLRREVEAVLAYLPRDRGDGVVEARPDPALGPAELHRAHGSLERAVARVHEHVARRVPELVAEVAVALDAAHVEVDGAPGQAGRSERGEGEAQRVRAVGLDPLRELPARRLLDARRILGFHEPRGALGNEAFEIDAVDEV